MSNFVHIDNNSENLKISEAAKILNVSTKTLRRWETQGIIKSHRSPTGNRLYNRRELENFGKTKPKKGHFSLLAITSIFLSLAVITSTTGFKGQILKREYVATQVDNPSTVLGVKTPQVLQAETTATIPEISNFTFTVNVPSKFSDAVTFLEDITAPNIVTAVNGSTGEVTLGLTAGDGITVDGFKITNKGILTLSAGTGISIDGNKITSTVPAVDLTESGWTDNGTSIVLTTTTDTVTLGTLTTGAITASSLTTDGLSLTSDLTVASGHSLLPSTDLGSDIGSASARFNNLWVANINSNSSQSFSGQTTFSYAPTDTTVTQSSVFINPTASVANGQLLALGIGGYQRALIDEDGDMILGYSDATSAPATDYPLTIYGHSGTNVAYINTSGNGYFAGNIGIGQTTPITKLHVTGATVGKALAIFDETGDQDIFTASASGVAKFTLKRDGKVGIGTTNPVNKLELTDLSANLTLHLQTSSSLLSQIEFGGASGNNDAGAIQYNSSNEMIFKTNRFEKVRIDSSGKMGIGNPSPTSKLHLTGAVTGKALSIFDETGDQALFTASASGVTKVVIDHSGNLGIGVAVPTFAFHLASGRASFPSGTSALPSITFGTLDRGFYLSTASRVTAVGEAGKPIFQFLDSTLNGLQIINAYPISWGTLDGTPDLMIARDAANTLGIRNGTNAQTLNLYNTYTNSTNYERLSLGYSSNVATFNSNALGTGTVRDFNFAGGKVGINNISPTSMLHVTGKIIGKALTIFNETGDQALLTASASGVTKFTIANDGVITTSLGTGTVYSNSGVLTNVDPSDVSLKHNILSLSDGVLNKVLGLRPVSYNWNTTGDGALGFIAQEVRDVFPDLVENNQDGTLGLYTTQFIPILTKAIQEQQLKIDEIALSTASASITTTAWDSLNGLVNNIKNSITEIQDKLNAMADEIFTKKSHQEELCIGVKDGETCIKKEQLDELIKLLPTPTPTPIGTVEPSPTPTESPENVVDI